ncbi:MAG: hypothetical protein JWN44_963 [Myxococcales bacterium]|nr:hypothetical protein [Myxococcales bacterium]
MTEPTRAEAKGAGFRSVTAVLREMLGPDAFAMVAARLSPATMALIKVPPLPVQWIACQCYAELIPTALQHGFAGDEARLVEMGRRAFLHDLKTLYRLFIKLMSPHWVIARASSLWLTYNRNNGALRARPLGDLGCEVAYEKVRMVYPGFWSYQRGCLLAAVQATGFPKATVVLTRGGGDSGDALFQVDWS